jgi:hypothetical protein
MAVILSAALASAAVLQKLPPPAPLNAPEISPALLTCAIVMAVGGLFILTDRLRRHARA